MPAGPFIFKDGGKRYLYVTDLQGMEACAGDSMFGCWEYKGIVTDFRIGGGTCGNLGFGRQIGSPLHL